MLYYTLDGHEPVPCEDVLEWGRWFETADQKRRVAETFLGDVRVSTVFLGLDHHFGFDRLEHVPILFETMVFGGPLDQEQERYATWDEAEAGHEEMVKRVREA